MEAFFLAFLGFFVCLFFWAYIILGFNVCFYQWSFHSNQSFCICRCLIPKSVLAHVAVTNMKLKANNRNLLSRSSGSQQVPDQVASMVGFWCGPLIGFQMATFSLNAPLAFPQCVPMGRGRDGQGGSKGRGRKYGSENSLESLLTGRLILLHLVPSLMTLFNLISSWIPCLQI